MVDIECNSGDSVTFQCSVNNVDPDDVTVRLIPPSGSSLNPTSFYSSGRTHVVFFDIENAIEDQEGVYTCEASGGGGVASSQATLMVYGESRLQCPLPEGNCSATL